MTEKNLRNQLLDICIQRAVEKESVLLSEYALYAESARNETKSTAGDKHDTSKSMMQLEQEKLSAQLSDIREMKKILHTLRTDPEHYDVARPGSVVMTDKGNFFLSVSGPLIEFGHEKYMPVSMRSPIGRQISGKGKGSTFSFNDHSYTIIDIQ